VTRLSIRTEVKSECVLTHRQGPVTLGDDHRDQTCQHIHWVTGDIFEPSVCLMTHWVPMLDARSKQGRVSDVRRDSSKGQRRTHSKSLQLWDQDEQA
jgi:hypothetical protein